jgi:hypothetical protein
MLVYKLLPFKQYTLITKLPTQEVRKRIIKFIEEKQNTSAPAGTLQAFEGKLLGDRFVLSRVMRRRNSFLPVVTGDIAGFFGHTQVYIKIELTRFILIFIFGWVAILGLLCGGLLIIGLVQFQHILQQGFSLLLLIPFGLFLVGSLLTILPFKRETKRSIQLLSELLDGKAVPG